MNIITEMLKQNRHDKILWISGVYLIFILFVQFADNDILSETDNSMFGFEMTAMLFFIPLSLGIITSRVCGSDLRDKTANYELLFGKKRYQVYLGRFFVSLITGLFVISLIILILIILPTVLNGWGSSLTLKNALAHIALLYQLMFRIVCFMTAFTFLCGNDIIPFISAIIGTALLFAFIILMSQMADIELTWQTALSDMIHILDFSNTTIGFENGKDITVYKASIETSTAIRSVLTSIGIGSAWLFGGYMLYRKRDT